MITATERARAARLLEGFRHAGAEIVETAILQPAGTLLDLYGEDIRARAFTTTDPREGEMMLRPDFTVPVAQLHMASAKDSARYAYSGEVFRRQEGEGWRAREYLQVGFEIFDGRDPAAADAEVFDLISRTLAPWSPDAAIGDTGLLIAAVNGLATSPERRAALRRHIWRPARFRRLMERFTGKAAPSASRTALLAKLETTAAPDLVAAGGVAVGLRAGDEIAARLDALRAEADQPPIATAEADVIDALLAMDGPLAAAVEPIRDMAVDLPTLGPAADRLEARAEALARRGYNPGTLPFGPARHRSSMEYYDGFTFTFTASGRPGQPPLATGGRYDALTAALGDGRSVPAVGGVIRPGLLEARA
ncbi:MAG: ATP phosphoribosyltransferase regulatory subunit [Pseudomonadota bacterium]